MAQHRQNPEKLEIAAKEAEITVLLERGVRHQHEFCIDHQEETLY